jgi:hypothetical protein
VISAEIQDAVRPVNGYRDPSADAAGRTVRAIDDPIADKSANASALLHEDQ